VLLVLVILAALGSMAVVYLVPAQRRAKIDQARSQIGLFATPLDLYSNDVGSYPPSLEALRQAPAEAQSAWAGPYLKSNVPLDPWYRPYNYMAPGRHNPDSYDVWSAGPDGVDGSEDDIGNW
jgi:general secretion pathway protein G